MAKYELDLDNSEEPLLKKDLYDFRNQSDPSKLFIVKEFYINNIISQIIVDLKKMIVIVLLSKKSFNRRKKSQSKFKREWVLMKLGLIQNNQLKNSIRKLLKLSKVKNDIINKSFISEWNEGITSILKK